MGTSKNTGINASREATRNEQIDARILVKKPEILADVIAELIARGVNVGGAFDAITAKAWRVWMTDAVSESFYSLSELFFYSGIDLVSDNAGTPFALNQSDAAYGADKLFDGFTDYNQLEHGWVSEQIFTANSTNYIGKIFDEPVTVDRYGMAARTYNATTITEAPISFELQYSNNTTDGTDGDWFTADSQINLAPWSLQGGSIRHWVAQNTSTAFTEEVFTFPTSFQAIVSLDTSTSGTAVFSVEYPEALAVDSFLRGYFIDETGALVADTSTSGGYPAYITIPAGDTTGSLTIDTTLSWLAGKEVTVNLYTLDGDVPRFKIPTINVPIYAEVVYTNPTPSQTVTTITIPAQDVNVVFKLLDGNGYPMFDNTDVYERTVFAGDTTTSPAFVYDTADFVNTVQPVTVVVSNANGLENIIVNNGEHEYLVPDPIPTYKAWRLMVKNGQTTSYGSVGEFTLLDQDGAAINASSIFASSQASYAHRAFDGFTSGLSWEAAYPNQHIGTFIADNTIVGSFALAPGDSGTSIAYAPKDFILQASADTTTGLDGNWVDYVDITDETDWSVNETRNYSVVY